MIDWSKYPEIRFCKVRKGTKKPFENDWTNKPYKWEEISSEVPKNLNYGVLGGHGGIAVIDSDTEELKLAVEMNLPETLTVKTGSGGTHSYFFIPDLKEKIILTNKRKGEEKHWGEVQSHGTQVVGPESLHPNGNKYEVIIDKPIKKISMEQLINTIKPYMKEIQESEEQAIEEKKEIGETIDDLSVSSIFGTAGLKKHGDEYFGPHPVHGSTGGCNFWINPLKNTWSCFRCHSGGGPLSAVAVKEGVIDCSDAQKGRLRGTTAYEAIKLAKEKYGLKVEDNGDTKVEIKSNEQTIKEKSALTLWMYEDFEKLQKDTNFFIQDVIYPKTITMLYSPPGQFKSLLALHLAMCVSTGKKWLNFDTQKYPVLYCDKENNDQLLKERLTGLYQGHDYNRKKFPLYLLRRNGDLLNKKFVMKLMDAIQEKGIKLVIFDTLHRFADYDENSSNDINRLYTEVFQPLVEGFGVSIIFLHHTKKDGGYRGSGDFLGMVDTAYAVYREGKTNKFRIMNEKCRAGEIDELKGEIDFGDGYIKFLRLNEGQEKEDKISLLKATTEKIKFYLQPGKFLKRKDILSFMEMDEFEFGSTKTVDRSLKWLYENKYIDKNEKGEYSKIL